MQAVMKKTALMVLTMMVARAMMKKKGDATMNVLDAIAQRRSIRSYKDEQITREQLDTLLQAGLYAPSAVNSQPWHFTAVQDQALIDRINAATQKQLLKTCAPEMRERFDSPAFHVFHHAPTVIFISCPPLSERRYAQTDVGIAIENMALAACGLGLGSVILGMPRDAFASPEGDEFRRLLHFPDGYDFCLALSVGVPAASKDAHPIGADKISYVL